MATCPRCGGSKNVETGAVNDDGDAITIPCPQCGGSGEIDWPTD